MYHVEEAFAGSPQGWVVHGVLVKDELKEMRRCLEVYKEDLESLRIGRLKVSCVGFIQEVTHRMTSILVAKVGKKLGKVTPQDRKKLSNGPFKKNQNFERKCGTYLDLASHNKRAPDDLFHALLIEVEQQSIEHYVGVEDFPKEPLHLRYLLLSSFLDARDGRDEESHIGTIKDPMKLDKVIKKVQEEIQISRLTSVGMEGMMPLVNAGIATCMSSSTRKEEEEDDDEERVADSASKLDDTRGKNPKKVKVTFKVRKRCELGSSVHITGFHKNLGFGSTKKAIPLSSLDGELWCRQILFSPDEQIRYRYVVRCLGEDTELSDTHEIAIQSDSCTFETAWNC